MEQEGRESVYDYFVEDIRNDIQRKDQAWEIPELISDSRRFRFEIWNYEVKDEQAVVEIKTTSKIETAAGEYFFRIPLQQENGRWLISDLDWEK